LPVARLLAILPGVNASHLLGLLAHRARPLLGLALALVLAAPAAGCAAVWETPTPTPEPTVTPAGTREPYTVATFAPPTPTSDVPLTPTPFLASLVLTADPVQSWTNPNDIQGLAFDGQHLWAATSGGVVRWSQDMSAYRVFSVADGLASPSTSGIAVDGEGHVWIAYAGLDAWSEWDGAAWQTYSRQEAVASQYASLRDAQQFDPSMWTRSPESGWVWMPTSDGQVRAYDGEIWRAYGPYEGVRRGARFVAVSADGRVWAVGDGVSTVLEGYRWWEDHSLFSEIPDANSVTSVGIDPAGQLWIGFIGSRAEGGGICSLDLGESRWTGHLASLSPNIPFQVHDMEILPDGTVWLCGEGGAAYQRPARAWRPVHLEDLTAQCLLLTPAGQLWLGTSHGIWSVGSDGRNPRGPWLVPTPFMGGQVLELAVDAEGRLLIGTPEGLAYAVPGGGTGLLLGERPTSLEIGPDGAIWVGAATGLYRAAVGAEALRVYEGAVGALTVDAGGTPWLATPEGALVRIGPSGSEEVTGARDLATLGVRSLAVASDGTLFIATSQGLGILAADGTYTVATVEDGLPDPDVRTLALGPDDDLWVGTAHGLARRQPGGRWTRYTPTSTEGGLRSEDIIALHVDGEGTLWITSAAGLSARTANADWSYLDVSGVRRAHPESSEVIWLGGQGGLYRVERHALVPVP
jgi:ligand-binding sensor domain-containing protein